MSSVAGTRCTVAASVMPEFFRSTSVDDDDEPVGLPNKRRPVGAGHCAEGWERSIPAVLTGRSAGVVLQPVVLPCVAGRNPAGGLNPPGRCPD